MNDVKLIKDTMVSVRINKRVKKEIEKKGLSVQKIIDGYVEEVILPKIKN